MIRAHQRHAAFTPACFALPSHGAMQTHFPPRPRKSAWHCDITDVISAHGLPTHWKQSYHTIPPIIPLTSDMPRSHQHVSRSPVARRHANAQIRMALRHHERNFATRSAPTPEAIISHDAANHHPPQRYAAFTPACFALSSGTVPRRHTFHQGRPNPHGTATSRTQFATRSTPHTRSNPITRHRQSSRSPATRRVYTSMFRAHPQWHGATQTHFPPRKAA